MDVSGAASGGPRHHRRRAGKGKAAREVEDEEAIDFLRRVLELDFESPEDQASALEFATRFQQTTGPVMAKALEDTTFYRYNRLIALNEVGGDPIASGRPWPSSMPRWSSACAGKRPASAPPRRMTPSAGRMPARAFTR